MFEKIDPDRSQRVGHVSCNTWITEAIQEKLVRDAANNEQKN